ncbi:hypothetical protein KIH78_07405 [Bifidobacterium sp. 79T10]|nr:hypothetical protein [Bifidobacterium saguinibicoloris]
MFSDSNLIALAITVTVTLIWMVGEICVLLIFRRDNPRSDELSDRHQLLAIQFAFYALIAVLMVVGFAAIVSGLILRTFFMASPMALPALAMLALCIVDARYLWLEHQGGSNEDDDE